MKRLFTFFLYGCRLAAGAPKEHAYTQAKEALVYFKMKADEDKTVTHYPTGNSDYRYVPRG